MAGKISSLMIWGVLLIIIVQFIPRSLAARNLENVPKANGWNENKMVEDQYNSHVNGSRGKHSGSADSAPAADQSGSATTNTNCNGKTQVATYYDANGNRIVKTTSCSSEQVITSTDANGNQHVVISRNGQTVDTANGGVQQTYNQYSPPQYYNENDPVTPAMSP